jgi:hypothetical protein
VKEREHLEYLGVDGRKILQSIFKKHEGLDWIVLGHDRDMWRAVLNTVMNFLGPINCEECFD